MKQYDNVCETAIGNYGLITALQARSQGVHLKDMLEWVKMGRLEKLGRGVYRMVHYLPTEYDRYAEAVALVGEDAMVWGESVLAMHNLALVNPEFITIATTHRVRKVLPQWLHVLKLKTCEDNDNYSGIPCQNLAAAIRSCKNKIMNERLATAVREAESRGLLGVTEAEDLKKEFPL